MLFWRSKVAYERSPSIKRRMASVAELKKSFSAEIDKVENREHLEKLHVKYLVLTQQRRENFLVAPLIMPSRER